MEDDGAPMDGRNAIEAGEHGQVPLLRLGMGRSRSRKINPRDGSPTTVNKTRRTAKTTTKLHARGLHLLSRMIPKRWNEILEIMGHSRMTPTIQIYTNLYRRMRNGVRHHHPKSSFTHAFTANRRTISLLSSSHHGALVGVHSLTLMVFTYEGYFCDDHFLFGYTIFPNTGKQTPLSSDQTEQI